MSIKLAALAAATAAACLSFAAHASEDHPTVEDAAQKALAISMALSESDRTEYGGVIMKCGDKYRYTEPYSIGESASFRVRVTIPSSCTLAGIYHTHPRANTDDKFFSPNDVRVAVQFGVPSFLGICRTGEMRVYRPRHLGKRARILSESLVTRGEALVASQVGSDPT